MLKIGVILSYNFYQKIKNIEPELGSEYEIIYLKYKDWSEVEEICFENISQVDAYIFGGKFVNCMIKNNSIYDEIPCFYFPLSLKEGLYKLLLKISVENGRLDLSRTYIDCIDEDNNYLGLKEIIPKEYFPYSFYYTDDEHLMKKALSTPMELWKDGKIDTCVTCFGSVESKLREVGLKTYYLYPSKESILNTFYTVANDLKIKQLENSQVAVGNVSLFNITRDTINFDYESEMNQATLYQSLISFQKKYCIPFVIQKYDMGYEIFISKGILEKITNNYSSCALLEYFKKSLKFKVNIGWGVGTNLKIARQNAHNANIESDRHQGNCSFVMFEQGKVVGPLSENNFLSYKNTINSEIENISKKAQLSAINIQKLIGIIKKLNTNKFSASDIAYYLGITSRSANRIINKLEQSGNAIYMYTKSEKLRGRPKKVYTINLPIDDSI